MNSERLLPQTVIDVLSQCVSLGVAATSDATQDLWQLYVFLSIMLTKSFVAVGTIKELCNYSGNFVCHELIIGKTKYEEWCV